MKIEAEMHGKKEAGKDKNGIWTGRTFACFSAVSKKRGD
jgi:hypothetical protein